MNKKKWVLATLILTAGTVLLAGTSRAGQVVTDDDRAWAKKAVSEEKALGAVRGTNTVAVLYFRNGTGKPEIDPLRKGIALMLVTDLSQVPDLQVVERVRLQALAEEMGLGTSGIVDPVTAPRVGRLLGARWLVGGDIGTGSGTPLSIRESVVDVPSGGTVGEPSSQGDLGDIFRIEKDLLFETIKLLNVEVTPGVRKRLEKPCSNSPAALLALSRGIDESDKGNYAGAADHYETALGEDPGVCLAAENLKELMTRGLVPPRKIRRPGTLDLLKDLKDSTSLTNQITTKDPIRTIVNPAGNTPANRSIDVTFP